jgi:methionyl aminopeptidase
MKGRVKIKTATEIGIMYQGGKKLALIRDKLAQKIVSGVSAWEIEELASQLIRKAGGKSSFKMVPGYSWSTCINVNQGVVHGIPKKTVVFKKGDLVSLDLGMFYQGFHTDTATTVLIGKDREKEKFLAAGKKALEEAISNAWPGKTIGNFSSAIEKTIRTAGYNPIRTLVGHGVGRRLHEPPPIPCFISGAESESLALRKGMCLAIEVMYALGSEELVTASDGWTISTKDAKIASLFEKTIAITDHGPLVLTE